MASDGCYRSRRMANRIAAARTADDRICMLQREQCFVGDLGILRRRVCVDRITGLSFLMNLRGLKKTQAPMRHSQPAGSLLIEEQWTPPRTLECSITFRSIS